MPDNEVNYLQLKDHDNDTDDIPDGMDPVLVHMRDQDGGWLSPEQTLQKKREAEENAKWDELY